MIDARDRFRVTRALRDRSAAVKAELGRIVAPEVKAMPQFHLAVHRPLDRWIRAYTAWAEDVDRSDLTAELEAAEAELLAAARAFVTSLLEPGGGRGQA